MVQCLLCNSKYNNFRIPCLRKNSSNNRGKRKAFEQQNNYIIKQNDAWINIITQYKPNFVYNEQSHQKISIEHFHINVVKLNKKIRENLLSEIYQLSSLLQVFKKPVT